MLTQIDIDKLTEIKKKMADCPLCHGRELACDCRIEFRIESNKMFACIPRKYRDLTWDSIESPDAQASLKKVKQYVEKLKYYKDMGIGLYLYGGPGTGKTAAGCLILIEAIKLGYKAYYTDINDYLERKFAEMFRHDMEEGEQNEAMQTADFLVIDNLDEAMQDAKGLKREKLVELLRLRIDVPLPNIVIARNSEKELTKDYAHLSSLFKEHFIPPIYFPGGDYRENIRKDNAKKHK
jgi:DNA replication protein DnaC